MSVPPVELLLIADGRTQNLSLTENGLVVLEHQVKGNSISALPPCTQLTRYLQSRS